MKKIKLFLITLLCVVGVMNVNAAIVTTSPHTQFVGKQYGSVPQNDKSKWISTDGYDSNDNHVTVETNASIAGFSFDGNDLVVSITSSLVDNVITINAPTGWVVYGMKFDVTCTNAKVTLGGYSKTSGTFDIQVNDGEHPNFIIEGTGFFNQKKVRFSNFEIYLKRTPPTPTGFLDSYGNNIEYGAMYVLGAEPQNNETDYFTVSNENVTSSRSWPADNNHFVNVNSVWEISSGSGGKFALQSMGTKKYLSISNSSSVAVASETKSGAMHFKPSDTCYTSQWSTPWFYSFMYDNKYLQYTAGSANIFSLSSTFNPSNNADLNKKFRFHKVEYVRIGVFTEQDGILEPLNYKVTFRTGDDPFASASTSLNKSGQSEICYEHGEDQSTHVVTRSIKNRITAITATNAPAQYESIKYIVNGNVVSSVNYSDIVSGYSISIIYVLQDKEEPDPDDPDDIAGPKFCKLYSTKSNKYLSSVNTKLSAAADGNDAIFYHEYAENEKKYLLSYTNGVYVKGKELGDIEAPGSDLLLAKYPGTSGVNAKYDVRVGNQYLTFDTEDGVTPDWAVKPSGEYTLEIVTELPVKLNTVGDHRYGTFYAPVDVTVPEGLEAYRVGGITPGENADVLGLELVTKIPANTGVILYEETSTETEYTLAITSNVDEASSLLKGVCPRRYVKNSETLYGLNKKSINGKDTAGFYKMKTGSALSPFRAFLDYTESEQGESKGFVFSFTELDAIEAIEMSHVEDAIYDLQGRKVQNPGTGIYIVNGKKIMIKK